MLVNSIKFCPTNIRGNKANILPPNLKAFTNLLNNKPLPFLTKKCRFNL